jgi:hypothetical protein
VQIILKRASILLSDKIDYVKMCGEIKTLDIEEKVNHQQIHK